MYQPLTSLVSQFGATWLYKLHPSVLTSSLQAMEVEGHCQAISHFLRSLLSGLFRHSTGTSFICGALVVWPVLLCMDFLQ